MSDLISKSTLIKEIWKLSKDITSEWETAGVLSIVERQPTLEYNGWIPCSERLPKMCVPVLVCNAEGRVYIRQINWKSHGKTEIPYWSQNSTGIIAWQPLPEPYKECER